MSSVKTPQQLRARRHARVRRKISGTADRPRLAVFRSNKHIYAQLIDDLASRTICAASSPKVGADGDKTESATAVGASLAEKALDLGIKEVVFDRGGFRYHGRVAAVAAAARAAGLKF